MMGRTIFHTNWFSTALVYKFTGIRIKNEFSLCSFAMCDHRSIYNLRIVGRLAFSRFGFQTKSSIESGDFGSYTKEEIYDFEKVIF